jgi:hypothetical protein
MRCGVEARGSAADGGMGTLLFASGAAVSAIPAALASRETANRETANRETANRETASRETARLKWTSPERIGRDRPIRVRADERPWSRPIPPLIGPSTE